MLPQHPPNSLVKPQNTFLRPLGEGKPKMTDEKETTVYKRALDMMYNLKIKASRAVFAEVRQREQNLLWCGVVWVSCCAEGRE